MLVGVYAIVNRELVDVWTRGHCFLANSARHGPGDVSSTESLVYRSVDLQIAIPRHGRQVKGVDRAEYHLGFRFAEGLQPQPVEQIGVQAVWFPTLDPLAGEQQASPDGAFDASDL